ncbi:MAG: transporter substrate-binding domain-containing protein [Pseudomonadales bacterium]
MRLACTFLATFFLLINNLTLAQEGDLLTLEEQAWLSAHPTIRHGVMDDSRQHEPFEYFDDAGNYQGLTSDYIEILEEKLGLRFEPRRMDGFRELGDGLRYGELDMSSYLPKSGFWVTQVEFSSSIISMPIVLLGRLDASLIPGLQALDSEVVAVEGGSRAHQLMQRDYPYAQILLVSSTEEGLLAVSQHDADVFMHNGFSAEYFRRKLGLSPLKVVATTPYNFHIFFAVNKEMEPLIPILEKVIDGLGAREKRLIFDKWVNIQIERKLDWSALLKWGGGALFLILFVIGGILVWNRKLASSVVKRTAELEKSATALRDLARHLEKVREEEKSMLAREIHDELGHTLTALTMSLRNIAGLTDSIEFNGSPRDIGLLLVQKLDGARELVREATQISRRIMSDLKPSVLDDFGLVAALEWLVHEFQLRTEIECHFSSDALPMTLNEEAKIALFRIVQESLTNIGKHAEAKSVDISLDFEDSSLCLAIEDDGKGLSAGWETREGAFGLQGMRERAVALEGELNIENPPNAGVRLSVKIPV